MYKGGPLHKVLLTDTIPQDLYRIVQCVRRTRIPLSKITRSPKPKQLFVVRLDDNGRVRVSNRPHRPDDSLEAERDHTRCKMCRLLGDLLVAGSGLTRRKKGELRVLSYRSHQRGQRQRAVVQRERALGRVARVLHAMAGKMHPRVLVHSG